MLKKVLRNWLTSDMDKPNHFDDRGLGDSPQESMMRGFPTLEFRVYKAVGGHVVEFYRYNTGSDQNNITLYTIPEEADFGQEISKISGLEILKN